MEIPKATIAPIPLRRPRLRRILYHVLYVMLGFLILLLVIAAFFDKQVCERLVAEINKNLKTELRVGDASLSLLSGFPSASINLHNVRIKDAFGGHLLVVKELSFRFDLFSLFGDDLKIHSLKICNGAIHVVVNRAGKSNTDIFKEEKNAKKTDPENNLRLALENLELQHIAILYNDAPSKQAIEFVVRKGCAKGNLFARQSQLSSQADLKIIRFDSGNNRYLSGTKLGYDAVLILDHKRRVYGLKHAKLTLGRSNIHLNGLAVRQPKGTDLNFKFNCEHGDIAMFANLLQGLSGDYFQDFKGSGNFSCNGKVKGRLSKKETPAIIFDLAVSRAQVSSKKLKSPLRNLSFKAHYYAQSNGNGAFDLSNFKGNFGGQAMSLSLKVKQLRDPIIDFQVKGALPLDIVYGLFNNKLVTTGNGLVHINRLRVQGRYADMKNMRGISRVNAVAEIQFDNAAITYNKVPLLAEAGFLRMENNEIRLDHFAFRAGKSDLVLDGSAKNLLPVLFADERNTSDAFLEFGADLQSQNFEVDQILDIFRVQATASQAGGKARLNALKQEKNVKRSLSMDKLKGTLEANISNLKYRQIIGKNFGGRFEFNHNNLNISGNTSTMQGELSLEGNAQFDLDPSLKMRITARSLDLQTMLNQCENFGQKVITDANLRGKLNGRVVVWSYWDNAGNFDMKRLRALADLRATNGELQKVKMFEDFSTYIHLDDLRRIKFTDMQNYLEVKDRRLYLPVMFIQSNAMNMTLSGEHTFDHDINYKIKVNAGQMILNRLRKYTDDLDPLPEQNGGFNLYYTIVGNLSNYEMRRKKKTVKSEFERSEARKLFISRAIDAEFGIVSVEPIIVSPSQPDAEEPEYLDVIQGKGH